MHEYGVLMQQVRIIGLQLAQSTPEMAGVTDAGEEDNRQCGGEHGEKGERLRRCRHVYGRFEQCAGFVLFHLIALQSCGRKQMTKDWFVWILRAVVRAVGL